MSQTSAGGRATRPPVALIAGCAFVALLLLTSLANLASAWRLQARLGEEYALGVAAQTLRGPMSRGVADRQLRGAIDDLLRRDDLGFRYLAVSDPGGVLLTHSGVFEALDVPLVPQIAVQVLRRILYRVTGALGQGRISADDGRFLGTVDYALSAATVRAVHDEAIDHLRVSGWAGLILGAPLLAGLGLALQRRLHPAPNWAQRLDWGKSPSASAPETPRDIEAEVAQAFRLRSGAALDALRLGIITMDRDGRVRYLNGTAERLTTWTAADADGRLVYSIFHPLDDNDAPLITAAEVCLREGIDQPPVDCRLRMRDGKVVPIEMMACLLRNGEGVVDGAAMLFRDTSNRAQKLEELRRQSRLSQGVIDHLDEGLLTTDTAGVVRFANARALRMFGYSREDLEGFTITKLMPVPFLNTPGIRITDYIAARGAGKLPKVVGWRKDATTFPVELWVQTMNVDGSAGLVVIVRDISERLRGENLATRLGRLLDSALEEVYIFDAQSLYFLEVNRGARRNLGYRPEQLARMSPLDISASLEPETFQSYLSRLRGGELEHLTYRCSHRRQDGSTYPVEVRLNFSREEEPPVFMAIAVDITERQAAEEKLNHLAHHDALTGLPNRAVLFDRLRQAILAAGRTAKMVGVYFVDLDRFKQINDQHGHEVGDMVLKAASDRLQTCLRAADTVARLGGDEFVIVAQGLRSAEDAEALAQKMLERFREPLDVPGHAITITPSIGVAIHPLDDSDAEMLLRHADTAMYQAKQGGRARYRLFSAEVEPEKRRRFELEREIHTAVALNQFALVLTPVVNAAEEAICALLAGFTWQHPRFGAIDAEESMRAANRAGLLSDLELWLVCNACEQFRTARTRGLPLLPVFVAVSGWQLRDIDFANNVLQLLERYEVPPGMLVLTLSQDGFAEARNARDVLQKLIQRGVRFALRDVSGGFESLNRDTGLPIGFVLLGEQALTRGAQDAQSLARLRKLIETAQALERTVIATGAISGELRDKLVEMGCNLIATSADQQGLNPRETADWLDGRRTAPL